MEYERRRQKDTSAAAAQLDYEILQEQAAALGRLGRAAQLLAQKQCSYYASERRRAEDPV